MPAPGCWPLSHQPLWNVTEAICSTLGFIFNSVSEKSFLFFWLPWFLTLKSRSYWCHDIITKSVESNVAQQVYCWRPAEASSEERTSFNAWTPASHWHCQTWCSVVAVYRNAVTHTQLPNIPRKHCASNWKTTAWITDLTLVKTCKHIHFATLCACS